MAKIIKYIFFSCFVLFLYPVNAQDTLIKKAPPVVMPTEQYDSENTTTGFYDRKEFGYFDSPPRFDEQKINKQTLSKVKNDDAYWYANVDHQPKKKAVISACSGGLRTK
jgi:hypothetical protein